MLLRIGFFGLKSAHFFSDTFSDYGAAVAATFGGYFIDVFYDLFVFEEGNDCFCHALLYVKKAYYGLMCKPWFMG
jgi:hypothetical protein